MKRKIVNLLLLTTMMVTLVACGGTTSTSNTPTNETQEDTQVSESENQEQEITQEEIFRDDMSWKFPSGMEGFTDKWIYVDDETWSYNQTHYVAKNGNVMNFMWNGPTELGEKAYTGTDDLTLIMKSSNDEYALRAWFGGELTLEELEECLEYSKEFWTSLSGPDTSFPEDGYYNLERKDNIVYVTHSVTTNNATGYARYLCNGEAGNYYMFVYLEENTIYDNERALEVINSLGYWDYEE